MSEQSPAAIVSDNLDRARYEARVGERNVGVLGYEVQDGDRVLLHTVVDPELDGHGIGSALASHAIEDARRHGWRVVPVCTFVQAWLDRHPASRDVVVTDS